MLERTGRPSIGALGAVAAAALLLGWVPGCFSGLDDLAPFPCAENGECPVDYACDASGNCVPTPDCFDGSICEAQCVDTRTDEDHCGACGNACSAELSCCGGQCLDLSVSDEHCGECGNMCVGGSFCEASACRCPDEIPLSCGETCIDPATNADHCGACDNVCQSIEDCVDSTCRCKPENTCGANDECVDLLTSAQHCGECDHACPSGECTGGVCTAIVLAQDQHGPSSISISADTLFWTSWGTPAQQYQDGSVMRMSTSGGSPTPLATNLRGVPLGIPFIGSTITNDGSSVYFAEVGTLPDLSGTVQVVSATGGGQNVLASGVTFPTIVTGGGSDLWFSYSSQPSVAQLDEIGRVALPGGGFNPVVQGDLDIVQIVRSPDDRLFFGSFGALDEDNNIVKGGSIWVSELDGSQPEQLFDFPGGLLLDLAVGENFLWFITFDADAIELRSWALDGSAEQLLVTRTTVLPIELYLHAGLAYFLQVALPDTPTCNTSDPMCTESTFDQSCVCTLCNDNGVCEVEEDCTCPDCYGDVRCYGVGICNDNDICTPYTEGCDCADCENHSRCSRQSWKVYRAPLASTFEEDLVAVGVGNASDFVVVDDAVYVTTEGTLGRAYSDGAILKGELP